MPHILENNFLQFSLRPEEASWDAQPRQAGIFVEGARMAAVYRRGRARFTALENWPGAEISTPERLASPHGLLQQLTLALPPDANGLRFSVTFALPESHPLLLWKLVVENASREPVYLDRLILLQAGPSYAPQSSIRNSKFEIRNPAFFSNGWQSWSYTAVYGPHERFRHTRLGPLRAPTDVNAGTPQPTRAGHFSSDMFGVLGDRSSRAALLAGFLSQCQHFGSLEAWLRSPAPALRMWANGDGARLDPGATTATDWACLHFLKVDDCDPLGPYLEAVARQSSLFNPPSEITDPESAEQISTSQRSSQFKIPNSNSSIPLGWCSWYQFSSENYLGTVTAEDILHNLQAIDQTRHSLPLEVVQIDDGFEAQVGDWFAFSPAFPQGVAPLADEIRRAGFTPGLWLAPFVVHPRSRLAAEHPDWLLRGRFNRPVNAGLLWNTFSTALDLTHPAALAYTQEVIHTAVHRWGFPYLKLDFLYVAALPGKYHDPTRTRAQVLRAGLQALRDAAGPEAFLLGCGCPLGPAIGLVDAMRISTDTARRWKPAFNNIETFFAAEPNLPSARLACHNSLTRAGLHRRWWVNDPDCLLVRPDTHLTLAEVQTVATVIALTGGSLLLSDHLPALPPKRLRLAQALLPPLQSRPWVLDWFDAATPRLLRTDLHNAGGDWHLLARFNWEDQPQNILLRLADYRLEEGGQYLAREFWSGEVYPIMNGKLELKSLPAHGVALLAVRRLVEGEPCYLGGDLHISQGLEVSAWRLSPDGLSLRLERPGRAQGQVELYLPRPPREAELDGQAVEWQAHGQGCYRFAVEFQQMGNLRIDF